MKMKIKKLATVQMGYSFQSSLEALAGGDVALIRMKDLLDDNTVLLEDPGKAVVAASYKK